jgi:hypothetical protein
MTNKSKDFDADGLAQRKHPRARMSLNELMAIARRYASCQVVDGRPADEIIGYDERGLPS